ncbi:Coenzyme F420 hydrogenase/dehydrogenase, beta subunit C-terminal domain [Bengtsoniella intestinalis]|uniref:Coenzyme F420 hydrogenase/dehydrogenase, beta subunit C-terminal domain n=1 Tax=Bengtsoniella intestinalis TaxID=3073143 RepID=UPI00391F8AF7
MVPDSEGFSYPHINVEGCVSCYQCTQVCPVLKPKSTPNVPVVYGAWNPNQQVRKDSSSGGIFSLLAQDTIAQGGVVFGAAFDSKLHLRHTAAFTAEQCVQFRGAKYVQSDLSSVYPQIKAWLRTRPVLFSGTPCQVDGLYQYLGARPDNLTTCDVVCHGVPSPSVWGDTVAYWAQKAKSPVSRVDFSEKVTGWSKSHLTIHYENGCIDSAPFDETPYGHAINQGLILRPSCHNCRYASTTRPGDLTLGDFWGLDKDQFPDQHDKGISLLMVNTAHGSYIFDQLPMEKKKCCLNKAVAGNAALSAPLPRSPQRASFFATYAVEPFETVYKRFYKLPAVPVRLAQEQLHKLLHR